MVEDCIAELNFVCENQRSRLIDDYYLKSVRALFWCGNNKLVISSKQLQESLFILEGLNYKGIDTLTPNHSSLSLCKDIIADSEVYHSILNYANREGEICLIPYANTHQFYDLVSQLSADSLSVRLPESPGYRNLWLRDYLNTKLGFRASFPYMSSCQKLLPLGFICEQSIDVETAALWIINNVPSRCAIIKPSISNDSLGQFLYCHSDSAFNPISESYTTQRSADNFTSNSFMNSGSIIVEEFIESKWIDLPGLRIPLLPSIEILIPEPSFGSPLITYCCLQLTGKEGGFSGVIIYQSIYFQSWYSTLKEAAFNFACSAQDMGLIGHFDIDAIIDKNDQVFLLEANIRRTGGTHVHELCKHLIGPDYFLTHSVLSQDKIICKVKFKNNELIDLFHEQNFKVSIQKEGAIPLSFSWIDENTISLDLIVISNNLADLIELKNIFLCLISVE
jgi:hypothetical protein